MTDFEAVAGHPQLRVARVIGHGGSGTVREVYDTTTNTSFARKTIRATNPYAREDIENEARANQKLCGTGGHANLIAILRQDWLPGMTYYYVDMELCAYNLDEYIGELRGHSSPRNSKPSPVVLPTVRAPSRFFVAATPPVCNGLACPEASESPPKFGCANCYNVILCDSCRKIEFNKNTTFLQTSHRRSVGILGHSPNHTMVELDNGFQLFMNWTYPRFDEILAIIWEIASGLEYIHNKGEVHRDLKPSNVLYSVSDNKWKIADFGTTAEKCSSGNPKTTLGRRGTGGYRAPELFDDHPTYTTQSDIWGLGCILHELVTFQRAFHEDWNVRDYARGDRPLVFPSLDFDPHTNTLLASIIESMLSPVPSKRPSAGSIRRSGTEEVGIASFWARKHSPLTAVRRFMVDPRKSSEINLPKPDELARIGSFRKECFSFSMELFPPAGPSGTSAKRFERQLKKRFPLNKIYDGVIYTEQRALGALYSDLTCDFLVDVLRTGPVNSVYSYVDIEGCIMDLDTFIHTTKSAFDVQSNIWLIMYHIMSGLEFIHERDWIHRAIVPSNILFSEKDCIWKIGSFESCLPANEANRIGFDTILTKNLPYDPPESHMKSYSKGWDIWQAGCILHELATRHPRFHSLVEVQEFVRAWDDDAVHGFSWFPTGRYHFRSEKLDWRLVWWPDGKPGIQHMLNPTAERRPKAGDLVKIFLNIFVYGTIGTPFLAEAPDSPPL